MKIWEQCDVGRETWIGKKEWDGAKAMALAFSTVPLPLSLTWVQSCLSSKLSRIVPADNMLYISVTLLPHKWTIPFTLLSFTLIPGASMQPIKFYGLVPKYQSFFVNLTCTPSNFKYKN
jgi:hypothetical protein